MTGESMLYWGLALVAASILMIVLEAFVPSGGILGLVAGALAIAGVVLLWRYDTTWGILGLLGVMILAPSAALWSLNMLPNTPFGRALMGQPSEDELQQRQLAQQEQETQRHGLVGREGLALTGLHPVGEIRVDDQRYEALAEHEWIEAGEPVRVTRADGISLKVRRLS